MESIRVDDVPPGEIVAWAGWWGVRGRRTGNGIGIHLWDADEVLLGYDELVEVDDDWRTRPPNGRRPHPRLLEAVA